MRAFSILVFNTGSSSLKFSLFNEAMGLTVGGTVSNIGGESSFAWSDGAIQANIYINVRSHEHAVEWVLDWLQNLWPFGSLLRNVQVVAHRMVHGGSHFYLPTVVTDEVIEKLDSLTQLAPLHHPQALSVIRKSKKILSSYQLSDPVLTVVVFDTAFFHELPNYTAYALPESLIQQHGIKRFGFHGFAHRYMVQQQIHLHPNYHRMITFQLGHGCSVAACLNGKPLDTSMGFTPLEGLVMATRAGDIDPGLLIYLLKNGHQLSEIEDKLLHHSGLVGIAKSSSDMRDLLNRQDVDKSARLAIEMFCYRARKYLGAYMAILNGADCIIFGGGIGENSPQIRQHICADMSWCGLQLDAELNQLAHHLSAGDCMQISTDTSKVSVYVALVDEALVIAEDAKTLVQESFLIN